MEIRTVGDLKEAIRNIKDDVLLDIREQSPYEILYVEKYNKLFIYSPSEEEESFL